MEGLNIFTIMVSLISALGAFGAAQIIVKLIDVREKRKDQLQGLCDQIKGLDGRLDDLRETVSLNHVLEARVRILRFSDEITSSQLHSQEMYDQVLEDIDIYKRYCDSHPKFENNKTVQATRRINDAYNQHLYLRDFL